MDFLPDYLTPIPLAFESELNQFNLQTGNVFYDTKEGYTQGAQHECISWCIQIQSSNRGREGLLTIAIYVPNKAEQRLEKSQTIRITQQDFIHFLKTGHTPFIAGFSQLPDPPTIGQEEFNLNTH